jgi:hypothetical protein
VRALPGGGVDAAANAARSGFGEAERAWSVRAVQMAV